MPQITLLPNDLLRVVFKFLDCFEWQSLFCVHSGFLAVARESKLWWDEAARLRAYDWFPSCRFGKQRAIYCIRRSDINKCIICGIVRRVMDISFLLSLKRGRVLLESFGLGFEPFRAGKKRGAC